MEDKRVSVEELKRVMAADFDQLVERVAEAMKERGQADEEGERGQAVIIDIFRVTAR